MNAPVHARATAVLTATAALPLLGALATGRCLRPIFEFPPRLRIPTEYTRFSWVAVVLVGAPFVVLAAAWLLRRGTGRVLSRPSPARPHQFPVWGWVALLWTGGWWFLAWTRQPWFSAAQRCTFLPLWLGFIIVVNALVVARTGSCLLLRAPRRWAALFAASALFWWLFEWLNRFSHNWHYLGVRDWGPAAYALNATLCFSTVLPAVTAVAEWLGSHPRFVAGLAAGPHLAWFNCRGTAAVLLIGGIAGLIGTGAAPQRFYPALWAAPLALFLMGEICSGRGVAAELARGDWRKVGVWAIAALLCGMFWEMWNIRSAARWVYTVPYVDRWHVFAMPLLGYTGYLPFGLECYFVATRVVGAEPPLSNASST